MRAEPLNKVLLKYSNKNILDLYNIPFDIESLECKTWKPSIMDKEIYSEDYYNKELKKWEEESSKLLFKNVFLRWESCDCGEGYGCSHGNWVYEINILKPEHIISEFNLVNRIKEILKTNDKNYDNYWTFSLEDEGYSCDRDNSGVEEHFNCIMPETLNDFINDCNRLNIHLEWNDFIVEKYFKL